MLGQLFMLTVLAVIVVLIVNTPDDHPREVLWGLAFIISGFASVWSVFALSLKRLNDLDWPRPLIILLCVAPAIVLFVVVLAAIPGSSETNEHGPPPFG